MQSYLENKIAVCEKTVENWKVAHNLAMQAFDCEELCEDMCSYFHQIDRQSKRFTDDVIEGKVAYDCAENERIKGLCRRWLKLAQETIEIVNECNRMGFEIGAKSNLQTCLTEALKSEAANFELYAIQKANEMRIPKHSVIGSLTSMENWPAY
jgi:hypothetical protein